MSAHWINPTGSSSCFPLNTTALTKRRGSSSADGSNSSSGVLPTSRIVSVDKGADGT